MGNRSLSPTNYLSLQAEKIIDENTTWVQLASELDVSSLKQQDTYPDWHTSTPFRPMVLAYLWALVEDNALTGIPIQLQKNPELAKAMGFDPDNLPSESTFRPVRLKKRFSDLEFKLEKSARFVRQIAAERGAPLGFDLGPISAPTENDDSELSERTIDRLLRKKGKEVLEEVKTVAIPSIQLPRPENATYDKEELLLVETVAAIRRSAANDAGKNLGDMKNPDPALNDPFYKDGPSGETLLEAMKGMSVDEIATVMNFALRKIYTRAKPRLQQLENDSGARFGARADIAIDITYVGYYGKRDEMVWLQGAPDEKEYNWCHKFATITIVGDNTHYVVGVCPLGSTTYAATDAYAGQDQSYYVGDVVRRLLSIAGQYVNIHTVYADREFHAADVIYTLEQRGLKYVIPAVKNKRIKRICNRFDSVKRGYADEAADEALAVKQDFAMYGRVKHEVSNTRVATTLVLLAPDEEDKIHNPESPRPFLTNLEVSDEIALDRRWTKKQIENYSDRGAIERSYTSIKDCAAWTTSKAFEVRWFHFGFACIIYNLWLLVDFLTQERIGVIESRKKPRISLARFLCWLERVLDSLL